jgi:hypothetical protein
MPEVDDAKVVLCQSVSFLVIGKSYRTQKICGKKSIYKNGFISGEKALDFTTQF